jgi:hypothetical protein
VTTPAPTLDGRIIGQTERSTRAVLERLLARHDTGFETWVAINLLSQPGAPATSDVLIERLVEGLRIPEIDAWATLDAARRTGLVEGTDTIALTAAGVERYEAISAGIAGITERLYADLPAADLEVAARVLLTLTERAAVELGTPS